MYRSSPGKTPFVSADKTMHHYPQTRPPFVSAGEALPSRLDVMTSSCET